MTNTEKMTARVARSKNSHYTVVFRQRLIDAQWEWVIVAGNRHEVFKSRTFADKPLAVANFEKIRHAIVDGRVQFE